jgi:hypothetical protein
MGKSVVLLLFLSGRVVCFHVSCLVVHGRTREACSENCERPSNRILAGENRNADHGSRGLPDTRAATEGARSSYPRWRHGQQWRRSCPRQSMIEQARRVPHAGQIWVWSSSVTPAPR